MRGDEDDNGGRTEEKRTGSAWICSGFKMMQTSRAHLFCFYGKGHYIWTTNVQNALKGSFGLSQKGYSFTSLQGFSNTVKCIGRDMEGSDAMNMTSVWLCIQ